MRERLCVALAAGLACSAALAAAVHGKQAMYIGGTVASIPENQIGHLDTSHDSLLVFNWPKGEWELSYKNITQLEFGRKVGRRVGTAIAATAVTPAGPIFLVSKKRKHFVTIQFKTDTGDTGVALFELSKGTYAGIIADLETKTGLKLEYEPIETKTQKQQKKP